MPERINRALIEASLGKWIDDIKTDTHRSVRRLTELGTLFSKGTQQKRFFVSAEDLLFNEESAYYALLHDFVSNVDRETVKSFCMAFGYNSLSRGAAIRRETGAGWSAVWKNGDTTLSKAQGTYTYFIFCNTHTASAYYPIIRDNPDCAFILFPDTPAAPPDDLHNLMTVLPLYDLRFDACAATLRSSDCLWGTYCCYNNNEAPIDISIKKALDARTLFAFFVAEDDTSAQIQKGVYEHVKK